MPCASTRLRSDFLLLALEHELHALRFLLRLLLGFDGVLERVRQLQVPQQDVFDDDAARLHLSPARPPESAGPCPRARPSRASCRVGGRYRAHRRAEVRDQQHVGVVGPDFWKTFAARSGFR